MKPFNHQPRKRFGQHFLTDPSIINELVMLIDAKPEDHLVEIGPGLGALTEHLIGTSERYEAVELDRDLMTPLNQKFSHFKQWHLHSGDALNFDFSALAQPQKLLRVVGNLPYNISTPLLFHLFSFKAVIQDMYFMLQKEVVDRLTAQPNDTNYGRLTLMTQYHCTAEFLLHVPAAAFSPPPKVESAIVKLTPHQHHNHTLTLQKNLSLIVGSAFNQRRKTIANGLKSLLHFSVIKSLGINPTLRPQQLSLSDYLKLAHCLNEISEDK